MHQILEIINKNTFRASGPTSVLPGGGGLKFAEARRAEAWDGAERGEARRAEAAGDRVQGKGCPLSLG